MSIRSRLLAFIFSFVLLGAAHGDGIINGGSGTGGGGTVTLIATACGTSGGPISTTGTVRGQELPSSQTGANYPFQDTDCGKLIVLSNGSNQIPTLGAIGSGSLLFAGGGFVDVCNLNTGTQTLTPTTSTIGGAAAYVLGAGTAAAPKCVTLVADATNNDYKVLPYGGGSVTAAQMPALTGDCTSAAGTVATTCIEPEPTAGYKASNFYLPLTGITGQGTQSTAPTINTIYCLYGFVPNKVTINNLILGQTSAVAGNVQAAIYANSTSTTRPSTLIGSTGSQSTASAGTYTMALAANKQVGPGGSNGGRDLWWCTNVDTTGMHFTTATAIAASAGQAALTGSATAAGIMSRFDQPIGGVSCTGAACQGGSSTFGTWPADLSTSTWTEEINTSVPMVGFQANSVP